MGTRINALRSAKDWFCSQRISFCSSTKILGSLNNRILGFGAGQESCRCPPLPRLPRRASVRARTSPLVDQKNTLLRVWPLPPLQKKRKKNQYLRIAYFEQLCFSLKLRCLRMEVRNALLTSASIVLSFIMVVSLYSFPGLWSILVSYA